MKVVVAAASRHGSTEMIADCLHEELEYGGCQADLMDPDALTSVAEYDAVVLGSAVYNGHWLKPARKLAGRLEAELRTKPVWLFSSGPVGSLASEGEAPSDALEIAQRLGARGHRVFPGRVERDQLGFGERFRLRTSGGANGDDRDWIEIGRWARSIAATLHASGVGSASVGDTA
jgi:menaquinone-dependent protoporphyrinogen oxidase